MLSNLFRLRLPPNYRWISLKNRFEFFHHILHELPLGMGNCVEYHFVILGQILSCPGAKNGLLGDFMTLELMAPKG